MERKLLSWGNTKICKTVGIFSLPRLVTCPGATARCKKVCYGKKANIYPQNEPKLKWNLEMSKKPEFVQQFLEELWTADRRGWSLMVRLTENGDIYSQAFLDKLIEIANARPDVTFLCFTKSWPFFNFSQAPANIHFYASVDETTLEKHLKLIPKGWPRAYLNPDGCVIDPAKGLPCQQVNENAGHGHCGRVCLHCWAKAFKPVQWLKH
jgi:hypothetical protein